MVSSKLHEHGTSKSRNICVRWGLRPHNLIVYCSSKTVKNTQYASCYMWMTWSSPEPTLLKSTASRPSCQSHSKLRTWGPFITSSESKWSTPPKGILLTQRHYVLNMLFKFGVRESRPISTPLDHNQNPHHDSGMACDETRFRQIFESHTYLTITRPNLTYPVSLIS